MKKTALILSLILVLFACQKHKDTSTSKTTTAVENGQGEETLKTDEMYDAEGFKITHHPGFCEINILSPWDMKSYIATYYLVTDSAQEVPKDGQKFIVPLTKTCLGSMTQIYPLHLLHELKSVRGMASSSLVYDSLIQEGLKNGTIKGIGDDYQSNLEQVIALQPEAFFISSFSQQDENIRRLKAAGVPVVSINEWKEKTPLGRAEWIKLYGEFFNQRAQADSIFLRIKTDYLEAKKLILSQRHKPSVMLGANYKGTWYMPGGLSYMATLLKDAGASYFYADDTHTGSVSLTFENVLHDFNQTDVWLNAPVASLSALLALDERHKLFKPTQVNNVFGLYKRVNARGANDFWESGVTRPDLVLKDFIWALYPETMKDYTPTYIIHLQ